MPKTLSKTIDMGGATGDSLTNSMLDQAERRRRTGDAINRVTQRQPAAPKPKPAPKPASTYRGSLPGESSGQTIARLKPLIKEQQAKIPTARRLKKQRGGY